MFHLLLRCASRNVELKTPSASTRVAAESWQRIARLRNRSCRTHQGTCRKMPARTRSAARKARRTAQPSSDKPRRFAIATVLSSVLICFPFVKPKFQNNSSRSRCRPFENIGILSGRHRERGFFAPKGRADFLHLLARNTPDDEECRRGQLFFMREFCNGSPADLLLGRRCAGDDDARKF